MWNVQLRRCGRGRAGRIVQLAQMVGRKTDIAEGLGIAAIAVAHTAELNVPGRQAGSGQSFDERGRVVRSPIREPAATMHEDRDREAGRRRHRPRQPEVGELNGALLPVANAGIRKRLGSEAAKAWGCGWRAIEVLACIIIGLSPETGQRWPRDRSGLDRKPTARTRAANVRFAARVQSQRLARVERQLRAVHRGASGRIQARTV